MDYPNSVPNVGLVDGQFADENPTTGQVGSLIPSAWGNAVTQELLNVIKAAGFVPAEGQTNQLLKAIQGLVSQGIKNSVRVATTGAIALSGVQTIDTVLLVVGDRVLVKNQASGAQNGIYVVAAGAWTRALDADESVEVKPGMLVGVDAGTVNGGSVWRLSNTIPPILGASALTFEQVFGKTGVVAGSYKSVTVGADGRVTGGTNPTTLAGFGIVDAFTKAESNAAMQAAIAALVGSSPAALDTINELAAALGNDPNFATTVLNLLGGKAEKADVYTKPEQDVARAVVDIDALRVNGPYMVGAGTLGTMPYAGALGTLYHHERGSSSGRWQMLSDSSGALYYRSSVFATGVWRDWDPLLTKSKLDAFAAGLSGYFDGLTMANLAAAPTTTVSVSPGVARTSDNKFTVSLAASMNAVLQSAGGWAAGNGGNKLDAGVRAANSWYHLFLIRKAADDSADLLFSLSATAPTMPVGYTGSRRIGSVKTDSSGNIIPFINVGRTFYFATPIKDVASSTPAASGGTQGSATLTLSVPPGVRTKVMTHVAMSGVAEFAYMRPTDSSAVTMANVTGAIPAWQAGIGGNTSDVDYLAFPFECLTDTASAVVLQWIMASSGGTAYYAVSTLGYTEL